MIGQAEGLKAHAVMFDPASRTRLKAARAGAFSSAIAVMLAIVLTSCIGDEGETFSFDNQTSELLYVSVEGGWDPLPPETLRRGTLLLVYLPEPDDPLHIRVVDSDGCTILSHTTTLKRFLDEENGMLTIGPDIPSESERAPCDPKLADILVPDGAPP